MLRNHLFLQEDPAGRAVGAFRDEDVAAMGATEDLFPAGWAFPFKGGEDGPALGAAAVPAPEAFQGGPFLGRQGDLLHDEGKDREAVVVLEAPSQRLLALFRKAGKASFRGEEVRLPFRHGGKDDLPDFREEEGKDEVLDVLRAVARKGSANLLVEAPRVLDADLEHPVRPAGDDLAEDGGVKPVPRPPGHFHPPLLVEEDGLHHLGVLPVGEISAVPEDGGAPPSRKRVLLDPVPHEECEDAGRDDHDGPPVQPSEIRFLKEDPLPRLEAIDPLAHGGMIAPLALEPEEGIAKRERAQRLEKEDEALLLPPRPVFQEIKGSEPRVHRQPREKRPERKAASDIEGREEDGGCAVGDESHDKGEKGRDCPLALEKGKDALFPDIEDENPEKEGNEETVEENLEAVEEGMEEMFFEERPLAFDLVPAAADVGGGLPLAGTKVHVDLLALVPEDEVEDIA